MSWVKDALKALSEGRTAIVCPQGGSMRGRIESGQEVVIESASQDDIKVGDVVFVRWKGNYLLHLAKDLKPGRILIGNNVGKINGWVDASDLLGKVVDGDLQAKATIQEDST